MKLRPRASASSSRVKNIQYLESSDDDDDHDNFDDDPVDLDSSDSDYEEARVGDQDDDDDNVIEENEEVKLFDLNFVPEPEVVEYEAPKRKKLSLNKNGKRKIQAKEEEVLDELLLAIKEMDNAERSSKKTKKRRRKKPVLMWEVWEEELDDWAQKNMMIDTDLDNHNQVVTQTAEPPEDLIMPLLRYQKEWLAWALMQEESGARGGILADEMGMGKTVQAIALVLTKRALSPRVFDPCESTPSTSSSPTPKPGIKATLVICPLVAVMQWVSEINRFTAKGSTRVLVYHGPNRGKTIHQFSEYDFVITTYSIVESEFRKKVMPPKQKCQWCGKLFYDHKISIHLKYFCGPDAVKTDNQSKQQSKQQQQTGRKRGLGSSKQKSTSHEGMPSRSEDGKGNAGSKKKKGQEDQSPEECLFDNISGPGDGNSKHSILHHVKWDRIILDEAHYIKDRSCNTTRAVLLLESSYKWALSGTPLQNRVGELYSLVRFLQITPFSYYFCKDCDCKALDYSSSAECPSCPHKNVRHFCWWNRNIAKPIQSHGNDGDGRKAMILLKHKILKNIILRRTKKGRAADLALPPRIVSLRRDVLDIKEEDFYTSLYNDSQAQFNTYVQAGTLMNNYAHIFDLLTRLRQAVDHPYLVSYSKNDQRSEIIANNSKGDQICGLCHDEMDDPVETSCSHAFCKSCLIEFSASMGEINCPTCSKPLTVDFSTNKDQGSQNSKTNIKGFRSSSILNRISLDHFQTSTKIDALREEIRFMVERDGSAKGIVFSQFTSFLDLIHYSLQKSGVNCVQLVGSMSMGARNAAITKFTEDPDCRIFLMSLKAGGIALNLTVASHVFLMDPWWNPAVERQAQDRIHRIGQYKPIRIVRFVIENTIEERILKLQEKKELVFEGTVGGSLEALGKLTEDDMRFLFMT